MTSDISNESQNKEQEDRDRPLYVSVYGGTRGASPVFRSLSFSRGTSAGKKPCKEIAKSGLVDRSDKTLHTPHESLSHSS